MEIVIRHVFDPSSEDEYSKPCVCVAVIQIHRGGNVAPGCIDIQKDIESVKLVRESRERNLSEEGWNKLSENKGHDFIRGFCNQCKSNLIFILITIKNSTINIPGCPHLADPQVS